MKNGKKGLLVASFGTAHRETREKNIHLLEEQIRSAFGERACYICYTSPTVRRLMERREGVHADGPAEALERMAADGMEDILIFATHVIPGIESERIARQAEEFQAQHPEIRVRLTEPLLWEEVDYEACAGILLEEYGEYLNRTEKNRTALILFGHGTQHAGDACYERLEQVMRQTWKVMAAKKNAGRDVGPYDGRGQVYVITVEGSRRVADILPQLRAEGAQKAVVLPFLLTAGEHVLHDMAGDEPDSVINILSAAGIDAVPVKKGLGEYEKIREYYVRRIQVKLTEKSFG